MSKIKIMRSDFDSCWDVTTDEPVDNRYTRLPNGVWITYDGELAKYGAQVVDDPAKIEALEKAFKTRHEPPLQDFALRPIISPIEPAPSTVLFFDILRNKNKDLADLLQNG